MAHPAAAASTGDLGWSEFLAQCVPVAEKLHRDPSRAGQDAYLYWLASMIARARSKEVPRARLGRFGGFEPPVHFGVSFRGQPFFIVEWWLEPGATLPPHCHPNASVCTLGIEGEARIRNFERQPPHLPRRQERRARDRHQHLSRPGHRLLLPRHRRHRQRPGAPGPRGGVEEGVAPAAAGVAPGALTVPLSLVMKGKLVIRSVSVWGHPNIRTWQPDDPGAIAEVVSLDIGERSKDGADTFTIRVATPAGLAALEAREGRHFGWEYDGYQEV
jgi:hypothetical protein